MANQVFLPTPALQPLVTHYLVTDFINQKQQTQATVPKGACALVFYYPESTPQFSYNCNHTFSSNFFLTGYLLKAININTIGRIRSIIVFFTPLGAYHVFKIPIREYLDCFISMDDIVGSSSFGIYHKVITSKNLKQALSIIESYLLLMTKGGWAPCFCEQVIAQICQYHGNIKMDYLMDVMNVTGRTLDRSFDRLLGISPKQYAWMERLNCVYSTIMHNPHTSIHEIVYKLGYFDQSHLINDLKKYSDITPSFLKQEDPLALLTYYNLKDSSKRN